MDATLRPDRETVAKDIDKMEGGRPVTQYDVLAWMQTRKRMIKKKEERTVCCSVLQCVAVCCSVRCVACCSVPSGVFCIFDKLCNLCCLCHQDSLQFLDCIAVLRLVRLTSHDQLPLPRVPIHRHSVWVRMHVCMHTDARAYAYALSLSPSLSPLSPPFPLPLLPSLCICTRCLYYTHLTTST